jgi:hypothetical protein
MAQADVKAGKPKPSRRHAVLAALLAALLAVSLANAATILFTKTVQITVGEPITLSNPNWLGVSHSVSPGENMNFTVNIRNNGTQTYQASITLSLVSNGPKGTARLYLNETLVMTAFFNGNSTSKTHTFNINPGNTYFTRLNLDIPSDSPSGNVNMTVTVQRVG